MEKQVRYKFSREPFVNHVFPYPQQVSILLSTPSNYTYIHHSFTIAFSFLISESGWKRYNEIERVRVHKKGTKNDPTSIIRIHTMLFTLSDSLFYMDRLCLFSQHKRQRQRIVIQEDEMLVSTRKSKNISEVELSVSVVSSHYSFHFSLLFE